MVMLLYSYLYSGLYCTLVLCPLQIADQLCGNALVNKLLCCLGLLCKGLGSMYGSFLQ